ncbi:MFS transporter [Amycolatopsis sp. NPDC004368]
MPGAKTTSRRWVNTLAWLAVMLDGFDLVMLGAVAPKMLSERVWNLTPGGIAAISTAGLVGMTVGGMIIGSFTHRIGRRKALAISVAWMSFFTILSIAAPSAFLFGLLRFFAGIGLGGCVPTALALVSEHSRSGKGSSAATTTMTGYQVGAMLTALIGIVVIPRLGWQAMFVVGAVPGLVLVPLVLRYLPDSQPDSQPVVERSWDVVFSLFRHGRAVSTLTFWVASFMGLLLVYGLNTWLPQIMRVAGYPLGTALSLLLTLNLGGMIGMIVAGFVADRVGVRGPPSAGSVRRRCCWRCSA